MSKSEAEQTVDRLIACWGQGDVEGMLGLLADDCAYHNMPMEPVVGTAAINEVMSLFFDVAVGFRIELHRQMTDGAVVMQERTDYYTVAGQEIVLPICGVFEVHDGRITAWREYFDGATGSPR